MPRFSIASALLAIAIAAGIVALNTRQSKSISKPFYVPLSGAATHPPPYEMKEMVIEVNYDRGWPIWHTRESEHFAAHNAALYLRDDRPRVVESTTFTSEIEIDFKYVPIQSPTNWLRAGFDALVSLMIVTMAVTLLEWTTRRFRGAARLSNGDEPTACTM